MQPIAFQHGSYLASWEKTEDVSCLTVWVCILFSLLFCFYQILSVRWIRDAFPEPDGDYTGFMDILERN